MRVPVLAFLLAPAAAAAAAYTPDAALVRRPPPSAPRPPARAPARLPARPHRPQMLYRIASSSYCLYSEHTRSRLATWECQPCRRSGLDLLSMTQLLNKDQNGYVAALRNNATGQVGIYVSFEGSETIKDWIENLKFIKTDRDVGCDGCKVHSGFHDCWLALSTKVDAEVSRLRIAHPHAPLRVTGHSKGAAVAVLAAFELQNKYGHTVDDLFTYGCPRIGNKAFGLAALLAVGTHWRVTHGYDPVPHLPIKDMGFHHSPTEVWYKHDPNYKVCDGSGEDGSCSNSNWLDLSIHDHLHYFDEWIGGDTCVADGEPDDARATLSPWAVPWAVPAGAAVEAVEAAPVTAE